MYDNAYTEVCVYRYKKEKKLEKLTYFDSRLKLSLPCSRVLHNYINSN